MKTADDFLRAIENNPGVVASALDGWSTEEVAAAVQELGQRFSITVRRIWPPAHVKID